jgi:hypothetical protein
VTSDFHLDDETLVVIGPDFFDDAVLGKLQALSLRQLLQRGLVVLKEQIVFVDCFEIALERCLDEMSRRLDTAIKIDGGDHRFEDVGEQRFFLAPAGLLFSNAEVDGVPHAVVLRFHGQAGRADEIRLDLGKRALVESRETLKKQIADDESENGVAEELEGLVILDAVLPRLVRIRFVGESASEEIAAPEAVTQTLFEFRQVVLQSREV